MCLSDRTDARVFKKRAGKPFKGRKSEYLITCLHPLELFESPFQTGFTLQTQRCKTLPVSPKIYSGQQLRR